MNHAQYGPDLLYWLQFVDMRQVFACDFATAKEGMQTRDLFDVDVIDLRWRAGHVVIDYRDRIIVARLTVVDDDCAAAHLLGGDRLERVTMERAFGLPRTGETLLRIKQDPAFLRTWRL
uniref:Uncharacterized protein n=1 Tax=Fusarium oxysporum (strain Fo5176) TaxID=660025 RepID=A0A0D2YA56_FUSOF